MATVKPAAALDGDTGETGLKKVAAHQPYIRMNGRESGLAKTAWLQAVEEGHKRGHLELKS
eukprot:8741095-Prorocentrum_lima.AAC.1